MDRNKYALGLTLVISILLLAVAVNSAYAYSSSVSSEGSISSHYYSMKVLDRDLNSNEEEYLDSSSKVFYNSQISIFRTSGKTEVTNDVVEQMKAITVSTNDDVRGHFVLEISVNGVNSLVSKLIYILSVGGIEVECAVERPNGVDNTWNNTKSFDIPNMVIGDTYPIITKVALDNEKLKTIDSFDCLDLGRVKFVAVLE